MKSNTLILFQKSKKKSEQSKALTFEVSYTFFNFSIFFKNQVRASWTLTFLVLIIIIHHIQQEKCVVLNMHEKCAFGLQGKLTINPRERFVISTADSHRNEAPS